jgi:hypothetical protein
MPERRETSMETNGTTRAIPAHPLDAARAYCQRGYTVHPANGKAPLIEGWAGRSAADSTDTMLTGWFGSANPRNLGIALGRQSGGFVDLDLDCVEAVRAAEVLPPWTGWVFGHCGHPRSHRVYRVENPGGRIDVSDPVLTGEDLNKSMLVELRADGCQTVFPPSNHDETGEPIEWVECGEPSHSDWSTLEDVAYRIAAAALLGRYWPAPESRHAAALALGGALARVGVRLEDATLLMHALCAASQDQEVNDRLRAVEDTYTNLVRGEPTTGWPELERTLGEDKAQVVAKLREWLGSTRVQIAAQTAVHGWEDPIPFAEYPVPPFPTDILPGWLGDFVSALAEATQTPPDLAAMLALGTAGAALARKYWVLARPGWSQPMNLHTVTALPSGTRKSAVFREATDRPPSSSARRWSASGWRSWVVGSS